MKNFRQWLEAYNPDTTRLYQLFSKALTKWWTGNENGKVPLNVSFTSEVVANIAKEIGVDFSTLRKSGIIVASDMGNYQLNKDLAATNGILGTAPPVPAVPGSEAHKRAALFDSMRRGPKPPPPMPVPVK